MTLKNVYENTLHDLSIFDQGNLHIDEFNHHVNRSVYNIVNKIYNFFNVNQQTSDDLQVLKKTFSVSSIGSGPNELTQVGTNAKYRVSLPADYYHLLNCLVTYTVQSDFKCHSIGDEITRSAKRLTSDMYARILRDSFQKPHWKRPYYTIKGTDNQIKNDYNTAGGPLVPNSEHIIREQGSEIGHNSFVDINADNTADENYGPTIEINYGNDISVFLISNVDIDYIKTPYYLRITPDQIESVTDISPIMEFPDYVCHEIVKEIVKLVLENRQDPRIQTYSPVNETIARGAQQ